jgi:hypothetical protein
MKGIKFSTLNFNPMPMAVTATTQMPETQPAIPGSMKPLTIAEAREGLAATFGVKPESVEITIRG